MLRSQTTTGLVLAGCLTLIAACGSDDESSASTETPAATEPPPTTEAPETTVAPTTTEPPETTEPPTTTETTEPSEPSTPPPTTAAPVEECRLIEGAFEPVAPGEYCVETIGAPFSISVPAGWWVAPNANAQFVLGDENSQGPGDRNVVMGRVTNLADPDDPTAPQSEQAGDWPLDDIEGWLATLIPGVLDGDPVADTLGGLDAVRFDVALTDEVECGGEFCVGFTANSGVNGTAFKRRVGYRVWWIDDGKEAPVIVMIADGGLPEFVERAEAMLDTMVFESIDPNPLAPDAAPWEQGISSTVPAGEVRLPFGPGVTFVTTTDHVINQDAGLYAGIAGDGTWGIDMYVPSVDSAGTPLETAADVIAGLELVEGSEIEIVGTRTIDGREAVEVSFTTPGHGAGDLPAFPLVDDPTRGWTVEPAGTMWIVELEDDIVFIAAYGTAPGGLDTATDAAQEILDSISFGD